MLTAQQIKVKSQKANEVYEKAFNARVEYENAHKGRLMPFTRMLAIIDLSKEEVLKYHCNEAEAKVVGRIVLNILYRKEDIMDGVYDE